MGLRIKGMYFSDKTQKGEKWQTPEILDKYSFVKNLQITITGIVALTHQSATEAPKCTTGENNFQFDSEKFLKTWTNESTQCFAFFFKYNLYQKTFKLHVLIPPLNQSRCLCISKTLNLICLFVLLLSLLVRATLTRVGFLPEETYFFQDVGRNLVSSIFFRFLPEEMEES